MAECSCGRRAVYSGDGPLCAGHFREWLEGTVVRELEKFVAGTIAVAVSGGKDSTTLLDIAHGWAESRGIRCVALCIDEGIEGYRNATLDFLRGFCREKGVELHVISFKGEFGSTLDELLERRGLQGPGACTVCGTLRRYLLNREARGLGATKLLLAHNRDDELQTLLMNLFAGNLPQISRKGKLCGVTDHPLFVTRFKPLVDVPEKALATYAQLNYAVPGVECPYLRESSRFRTRQLLNELESGNPGAKERMMELYLEILPRLKENPPEQASIRPCAECGEPSSGDVCRACSILKKLNSKP